MLIQIRAPWEVNDYLKGIIENKLHKLEKITDDIIEADVYLKMGDSVVPNDKITEIRLLVPGHDLFADSSKDSFEKSVADVTSKLRVQLIKRKEKLQDHSNR